MNSLIGFRAHLWILRNVLKHDLYWRTWKLSSQPCSASSIESVQRLPHTYGGSLKNRSEPWNTTSKLSISYSASATYLKIQKIHISTTLIVSYAGNTPSTI
eukprot:366260-Chlamydomonas_euryale.AAC.8